MSSLIQSAAAAVAIFVGVSGATTGLYKGVGNDWMPLEGKKEHTQDITTVKEAIRRAVEDINHEGKRVALKGQVIGAWDRCITAMHDPKKIADYDTYRTQLAELQDDYASVNNGRKLELACQ